jgi:hypothetical protein
MTWESAVSGRNTRVLAGSLRGDELSLHDTAFETSSPKPGWMFCLIDRYRLQFGARDELRGDYWSNACSDHATVSATPEGPAATVSASVCDESPPLSQR